MKHRKKLRFGHFHENSWKKIINNFPDTDGLSFLLFFQARGVSRKLTCCTISPLEILKYNAKSLSIGGWLILLEHLLELIV